MDGSKCETRSIESGLNQNPQHPHQILLTAQNKQQVRHAFLVACPGLSEWAIKGALRMHSSAQYHFIQMLMWIRPGGTYLSQREALREALGHHKKVTK